MKDKDTGTLESVGHEEFEAIVKRRRQIQVDATTQELAAWLDSHNVTLKAICGFGEDGRHVTQIQVVLKQ